MEYFNVTSFFLLVDFLVLLHYSESHIFAVLEKATTKGTISLLLVDFVKPLHLFLFKRARTISW